MKIKAKSKEKAVELRKRGFTYSEILRKVPVAKSTLSLWLRDVGLSERQRHRITKKKLIAAKKGAKKRQEQRKLKTKKIKSKAYAEIDAISDKELWLLGIALYWAEGTKEKSYGKSQRVSLSNSDSKMIKFFYIWLKNTLKIRDEDITYDLLIHQSHEHRLEIVIKYWTEKLNLKEGKFDHIYYKKHNLKTNRKRIGNNYFGLVRVTVKKSIDLNRKISGWIEGICDQVDIK